MGTASSVTGTPAVAPLGRPTALSMFTCEFIGTLLVTFTAVCNSQSRSPIGGLSVAAVVAALTYAMVDISGAHFNPAASLGVASMGCFTRVGIQGVNFGYMGIYIILQFLGGVAGAFAAGALYSTSSGGPSSSYNGGYGPPLNGGVPLSMPSLQGNPEFNAAQHMLAEMLYTAFVVFVLLSVTVCKDIVEQNNYHGLAIGCAVAAGITAIGHMTGGVLNPAISLGVAAASTQFGSIPADRVAVVEVSTQLCMYVSAQFAGTGIAVGTFWACRRYIFEGGLMSRPTAVNQMSAEFAGTFIICLTAVLVISNIGTPPLLGVLGIAAAMAAAVYALWKVSGAHFNPALSLGVLMMGQLEPGWIESVTTFHSIDFGQHVMSQFAGATAGVGCARLLAGPNRWHLALVVRSGVPWAYSSGYQPAAVMPQYGDTVLPNYHGGSWQSASANTWTQWQQNWQGNAQKWGEANHNWQQGVPQTAQGWRKLQDSTDENLAVQVGPSSGSFLPPGKEPGVGFTVEEERTKPEALFDFSEPERPPSQGRHLQGQGLSAAESIMAKGSWGAVAGSEFVFSFVLALVFLNIQVRQLHRNNTVAYFGAALGAVVLAGMPAVGRLSGGLFNPALTIAMDIFFWLSRADSAVFGYSFLYAGIQMSAALCASLVVKMTSIFHPYQPIRDAVEELNLLFNINW